MSAAYSDNVQNNHKNHIKMSAYLASIVKGEPEEEDVREELNNAEESVNNPVGEPLCVILLNIALDGLNTEWRGEQETDEVTTSMVH